MKKSAPIFLLLLCLLIISCKQKKTADEPKETFFPVLSFIKSQIAHIDTSLYSIKRIDLTDTLHFDTVYVPREEFRSLAKDFLSIPDIAEKKYSTRYTEEKIFDETLNRVIISYKPVNIEKEEVQKQEVLITPDPSGDKVSSLIIDYVISNKDSFLMKRMLWETDKSFQVTTTAQKPGKPEATTVLKVIWE